MTGDVLNGAGTFSGSEWIIPAANNEDGASVDASFTDDLGSGRRIDLLQFFAAGNVSLDLDATELGNLRGFGGDFTLSLGAAGAGAIDLRGDTHTVTTVGGDIGRLWLRGASTLDINSDVGVVNLAGGTTDTVTLRGTTNVSLLREFSNALALDLHGDAHVATVEAIRSDATISLFKDTGISTLDISRGSLSLTASNQSEIGSAELTGADSNLTVNGAADIADLRLEDGTFSVTGTGGIGTLSAYGSKLTVNLDLGADTVGIFADGAARTHNITLDGVTALTVSDDADLTTDNQRTILSLTGDSGTVRLGNGNDTVTLGDIAINSLGMRGGNDTVTHGGGETGIVRLGSSNDQFFLDAPEAGTAITVIGGTGTDLINFNAIGTGVTFALNARGAQQTLGNGLGSLSETGIENLTGTARDDRLTGDFADNILKGGAGRDTLDGGVGRDRLTAGLVKISSSSEPSPASTRSPISPSALT